MTKENEELLLVDLCARLLYEVHCRVLNLDKTIKEDNDIICGIVYDNIVTLKSDKNKCYMYYQIKPYLRSLSSMTEEERRELCNIRPCYINSDNIVNGTQCNTFIQASECQDWLNAHHFDYRGLIEKGLALEAPEGMYTIKGKYGTL